MLPVTGFLINGLLGRWLNKTLVAFVACGAVFFSFLLSAGVFWAVKDGHAQTLNLFEFIRVPGLVIPFSLLIDSLSSLFLLIITGIGFVIHLYSAAYMKEETTTHYARYFAYLNLFIFSMLLLVLGANYVILFIGWEGVGLCSYLLIGYWFQNDSYNSAAKKAFVMNRIGDLGFLLAVFMLINQFGTVSFQEIFSRAGSAPVWIITGITLLLFVGATGKSAQIPLFTWLPDAMAGPTPVSALIHAATMVTAGIYLIARSHVLFTLAPLTREVVAIVGLATALLAATIALYQNDIKKILAYSTVSQLGLMFLALGLGAYTTGVFHVMTHAFFKALLFLGAGSVIHAMSGEQDILKMGGLRSKIPVTFFTFLIGVLAICGFPFTSGFISKDEILVAAFSVHPLYFAGALLCAFLTMWYMFRLFVLTFFGTFRGTPDQLHHLHESPALMTVPLILLALLSLCGGWVQLPELIHGHPYLNEFLSGSVALNSQAHGEHASLEFLLLGITTVALAVVVIATSRLYTRPVSPQVLSGIRKFFAQKWYVDELYDAAVIKPLRWLNEQVLALMETEVIDWIVNGVGRLVHFTSRQIRLVQSGQIGNYILLMVISIVGFFLLILFGIHR